MHIDEIGGMTIPRQRQGTVLIGLSSFLQYSLSHDESDQHGVRVNGKLHEFIPKKIQQLAQTSGA